MAIASANKKLKTKKTKKRFWKFFLIFFLFLFGLSIAGVVGVFAYFAKDLPDPGKINKRVVIESTKIFDRTGEHLLYEIHGEEKRTLIAAKEIPDSIKYATLVLEDQDFYRHQGIKLSSIMRALLKDIIEFDTAQGGSTITQQFIKNSILTPEQTLSRKIKEVILAIEIEQKFSKDEILAMYLNEIPYGSNSYGIEAAAQTFFSKHTRELMLDEAALLASLPKAPTLYSPFGSNTDRLEKRQELAIRRMAELGYITQEQAQEAIDIDTLDKVKPRQDNISAPHFVMYVREYLENKYGREFIEQEGLNVYTTLDWDKQEIAQRIVKEGADKNKDEYNAENAALVTIDPKTGQILTMVGSKDYFDSEIDGQVNVAIRDRQPGSSFKPYVYLTAFTKGYTPETILFDVETQFGNEKKNTGYKPQNYDNTFRGPMKIKKALGMSLNIPAVKALYLAGVNDSIQMAKNLGIEGLNKPDHYGLALVLGGGEVRLVNHVYAFSTIANEGVKQPKTAILRVQNKNGEIIEEYKPQEGEPIVDKKYIAMLSHILSTNKYRVDTFGVNNPFRFDYRPVAAKTGTTNEYRDGWAIGYTPNLAVGVWAGNNDNSPMKAGAAGTYVAAPIWRAFMDEVLQNYNLEEFPEYIEEKTDKPILDGELDVEEKLKVCEIPGKDDEYCLANKHCKDDDVKTRYFIQSHSILWYVDKDDPQGDYPKKQKDPQFKKWEEAIEKYYEEHEDDKKYIVDEPPEKDCSQDDFSKYFPDISIESTEIKDITLIVKVKADAPYGVNKIKLYVDDIEVDSTSQDEHTFRYAIPADKSGETLKIRAKVEDDNGNEDDTTTSASP